MSYVSEVMSDNDSTRRKSDLTLYVYCILISFFLHLLLCGMPSEIACT